MSVRVPLVDADTSQLMLFPRVIVLGLQLSFSSGATYGTPLLRIVTSRPSTHAVASILPGSLGL
jgi:hypothetical protein